MIPYKKILHKTEIQTRFVSACVMVVASMLPIAVGGWLFVLSLATLGWFLALEWIFLSRSEEEIIFRVLLVTAILLALAILPFYGARSSFASCIFSSIIGLTISSIHKRELLFVFLFGLFFLPFTLISLAVIRYHDEGLLLILWLIAIISVTDSAAFFVGRTFKGPKIFPRISPNKTWSGFLGGTGFAVVTAFVFAYFFLPDWTSLVVAITALMVSLSAQLGDLTVSAIKRHNKLKDTGNFIPGHGGLFDRFDSYLFAPSFMAFMIYFHEAFLK